METTKCSETSFKGKTKIVDTYRVSFDGCRFIAESQLIIPGDLVNFLKTGHIYFMNQLIELWLGYFDLTF